MTPTKTPLSAWPRTRVAVEWIIVALLAWRFIAWATTGDNATLQPDFTSYFYVAAWRMAHGMSPHAFVTQWGDGYPNPPWFALLLTPLTLLPPEGAAILWLLISLGLLTVTLHLSAVLCGLRLRARRLVLVSLALTAWQPLVQHLWYGQNSLLVAAASFGAVLATRRGRYWLAGFLLVLAVTKPHMIYLLGLGLSLWTLRQHRSIALPVAFVVGVVVASLVCFVITPTWLADLLRLPRPGWAAQVDPRTMLLTAFGYGLRSTLLFLAITVPLSVWVLRRWAQPSAPLVETAGLTFAATMLAAPYAQLHDYVLLILPLMLVGLRLVGRAGGWWQATLAAAAVWTITAIDVWFHGWLEHPWVWSRFERWFGEEGVAYLWEQSKWNWRFAAMLVPLGCVVLLANRSSGQPRRRPVNAGAGPGHDHLHQAADAPGL